jgi:hypothetical protein
MISLLWLLGLILQDRLVRVLIQSMEWLLLVIKISVNIGLKLKIKILLDKFKILFMII